MKAEVTPLRLCRRARRRDGAERDLLVVRVMLLTRLSLLALLVTCSTSGCLLFGEQGCDFDHYFLEVRVVDAATGAQLCDATVTAAQGQTVTSLSPATQPAFHGDAAVDCSFRGGHTPGTYTITASRSGYAPQSTMSHDLSENQRCPGVPENAPDQVTIMLMRL
jgi:hypothetical protein